MSIATHAQATPPRSFGARVLRKLRVSAAAATLAATALASTANAQADPWADLGGGLSGTGGTPTLSGYGSLYPGSTAVLRVTNAVPFTNGAVSFSFAYSTTPVLGGTAHTLPSAFTSNITTDANGRADVHIPLPANNPGYVTFYAEAFLFDPGAPQGISISNTMQGYTADASQIPDPGAFFNEVVLEAFNRWQAGEISDELLNYLSLNGATLSTNAGALLDAITPVEFTELPSTTFTVPGGGTRKGKSWLGESLVGLDVLTAQLEVPWTSTTCRSTLGTPVVAGHMIMGSVWAETVGAKWTRNCGFDERCEGQKTAECGNFRICYKQTFVWFLTLSSGHTKSEQICAPCP